MTAEGSGAPSLRRALVLMTATSLLVPAGGLLTAPILAHALNPEGRGELAAATAPGTLMISIAALGLPDALTYFVARRPAVLRRAVGTASAVCVLIGLIAVLIIWTAAPFLSAGNAGLAGLILLATMLMVPSLAVSLLRGAAIGANRWGLITAERISTTSIRVLVIGGLWLAGELTVLRAVLVAAAGPVAAGAVYLPMLLSRWSPGAGLEPAEGRIIGDLLSYGARVWLGSIAEILLARISQLLMIPLADARQLGIFVVAITISDVTFILAQAIQSALFGVSSGAANPDQVTLTCRLALLITIGGAVTLGTTLPFWIAPVFGAQFGAATLPTVLLLAGSVAAVPAQIASAGVSAWGRPGIRSTGLLIALTLFVGLFIGLVPSLGAYGACIASIVANSTMATFLILCAGRVMSVPARDFVAIRAEDISRLAREARSLFGHLGLRS